MAPILMCIVQRKQHDLLDLACPTSTWLKRSQVTEKIHFFALPRTLDQSRTICTSRSPSTPKVKTPSNLCHDVRVHPARQPKQFQLLHNVPTTEIYFKRSRHFCACSISNARQTAGLSNSFTCFVRLPDRQASR